MKYKFLLATTVFALLLMVSPLNGAQIFLSALTFWGLLTLATPRRGYCLEGAAPAVLSEEMEKLFKEIGANWQNVKGVIERTKSIEANMEKLKPGELPTQLEELTKGITSVRGEMDKWKKDHLAKQQENDRTMRPGCVVTDACARYLAAIVIQGMEAHGKLTSHPQREKLCQMACDTLGVQQRSTLTTSDIPMPTDFGSQVVELVWKYGQARQYATIYPLGTITVKLPKLTTSPKFGPISIAATVTEKSPQFDWVTFTAVKYGGLVRFPSEIDADSIVPLGNFIARYIAREMAVVEDANYFAANASGVWAPTVAGGNLITGLQVGLLQQADTLSKSITLPAGKTAVSDVTLAEIRGVRALVSTAVLQMGSGAYYMNPTLEAKLPSLNTLGAPLVYRNEGGRATIDGWPIRWVDVLPPYDPNGTANADIPFIGFGDASYHYFGLRSGMEVAHSRDVFFATDEIAIRALERFATGLMADTAFASVVTAAA